MLEEVHQALDATEIYVLTCRNDTFPMTIVEACSAGKPMVVTDTCEIADIIAGKVATVVPVDTDQISQAIQELLEDDGLTQVPGRG